MSNLPPGNLDILRVEDVLTAPMPQHHKEIVLMHLKRLQSLTSQPRGEDHIARSMTEEVAQQQLDKMTKVFRLYQARQQNGEFNGEGEVESMMTDLVDGCILMSLTARQWEPDFPKLPRPSSSKAKIPKLTGDEVLALCDMPSLEDTTAAPLWRRLSASYWREFHSRPRARSDPVRSPSSPRSPTIIRDRPAFTRILSQEVPRSEARAKSRVAWGAWPLPPEEEREWFALGLTGTCGGRDAAFSWADFMGWSDE